MADPIQLDYAPRPPALRRHWRRTLALLLLLLAGTAGYRYHRPAWDQLNQWYWQRQCMRHLPPAGAIAYDETGKGAPRYSPTPAPHVRLAVPAPRAPPTTRLSYYSPVPNSRIVYSALFLHARRAPGGPQRLLSISAPLLRFAILDDMAVVPDEYRHLNFSVQIIRPASLWQAGRRLKYLNVPVEDGPCWNLQRLYAGHPDPADESHFTIEFEANGQRGVIDGWLRADDTVELRARSPVAQGGH